MELSEFYMHHGLRPDARPFDNSDDAKSDTVLTEILDTSRHRDWSRFFGEPGTPATAVIFGEKGSGKTALRLQMKTTVKQYNKGRSAGKVFVVDYADFNPFLSAFQSRLDDKAPRSFFGFGKQKTADSQDVCSRWKMPDHLDVILSLAITQFVTELLAAANAPVNSFPLPLRQELTRLALMYDHEIRAGRAGRIGELCRRLGIFTVSNWLSRKWDSLFSIAGVRIGVFDIAGLAAAGAAVYWTFQTGELNALIVALCILLAGHIPGWVKRSRRNHFARQCLDAVEVLPADVQAQAALQDGFYALPGNIFHGFTPPLRTGDSAPEIAGMEGNRYDCLRKFQEIIACAGYSGILVLVDQIDEPSLMGGDPKRMWTFIRSLLDNKLMQHPNMGIKFLLLDALYKRYEKEDDAFRARARLDKQNMVRSLEWSGANLLDLANHRLAACSKDANNPPRVEALFDENLHPRLLVEFARWKNPRNLFKFLDAAIKSHIGKHPSNAPVWTISEATFEAALTRTEWEKASVE